MSTINLLPDDYIRRYEQHRANTQCTILFALVMAGVLSATYVSHRRVSRTQAVLDELNVQYDDASKLIQQMQQLEARRQQVYRKAELTASLLERVPRSTLMAFITNSRPKNVSLSRVELSTKQVTVAQPKPATKKPTKSAKFSKAAKKSKTPPKKKLQVTVELTGHAATDVEVARFIRNLASTDLTKSVDLQYTKEAKLDDAHVREFKVVMELNDNADAITLTKRLAPRKSVIPSLIKGLLGAGS